jgi:hypothetical protein
MRTLAIIVGLLVAALVSAALLLVPLRVGQAEAPTLVAVGDIADDTHSALGDNKTAELIEKRWPTAEVATLGDNAYESATISQFNTYYHDANPDTAYSWGLSLNDRVHPSPGNHEYYTQNAQGYIDYYGQKGVQVGKAGELFYSYTLGSWRVISLNSNIAMASGSAQHTWLKSQLQAAKAAGQNTVLYFHHPLLSSGRDHGWRQSTSTNKLSCAAISTTKVVPLWQLAYENGGDVILSGHTHAFERFARVRPDGVQTASGIPSFIAGTGGKTLNPFRDRYPDDWNGDCGTSKPQSMYRYNGNHGVLKLELYARYFAWVHVTIDGTVRSSGTLGVR